MLMALPWLVAIAIDYAAFQWVFRADLTARSCTADLSAEMSAWCSR